MDLEKFLERDMIEFIENKDIERKHAQEAVMEEELEEEYSETKSGTEAIKQELISQSMKEHLTESRKSEIKQHVEEFSEKIFVAIQNKDLAKAMVLYKSMKHEFKKYPEKDEKEKEKLFNDLIEAYYQIKKLEKNQLEEKIHVEKLEEDKKEHLLGDVNEKIQLILKKIKVYLNHDDITKAMEEYDKLKTVFEKFPREFKEERRKLYDHMVVVYNEIHKQSNIQKQKEMDEEKAEPLSKEKDDKKGNINFLIEQKKKIRDIISLMKQKNFEEAGLKLLEAKQAINRFPEEEMAEKEQYTNIVDEINHRLNFLKQTMEINN
ncbi:MAG: hypothetical protein ABH828_02375 [archaeon]